MPVPTALSRSSRWQPRFLRSHIIESPAGSIYLETDAVDRFVDTYDWLEQHSLSGEESNALLADLEKEFQ